MKATGIVRRIDDLGRVVIPKEIRRTLRIREGDPLEIFTDRNGEVIFKKYSPIGELGDFAVTYVETLAKTSGRGACITDRDSVIAVSKDDVMVLHCLPAHREEEITAKVFEEHANEIFDEAENRLHAQKAVLVKCFTE